MYVSPAKQIYKCFSCGAGGDAFSFMMGYHKMTFPEALKHLAERAGIVIPEFQPAHNDSDHGDSTLDRTALLQASNHACSFYQTVLRHREHGQSTRDYITHRHINSAMVDAFQLGYAPDRWDGLMLTITDKNWRLPAFEKLGLVSRRTTGDGYYDRFRNRLMFPICDSLGRVIAFGGRKLREEDEPKYLNSPESTLFNKSATLYGLHLAKKTIIQQRTAVVVEGYTDVIACHQHGISVTSTPFDHSVTL
ncbi:MAG: DNA primase, partial [Phycisphaerales bacterium]|nr:DNA primase [Phycisphaerales bacterium]